ncbi:hypothetical protein [Haloferax denitrificans]|uniref:Small CPxCG-related zinc finger protein n=1 Tax=Haloferax denitrificans ATCC 35960 TaxID=662478 RepID=M0J1T8_9EURY|nr:hypothetical protein [Haloferax denitrificans]EMA01690.1 hypothetical protein C438_15076 [Haloferax denitrificans ATCC 35960]
MHDSSGPDGPPTVCGECGARHSFRRRYVTGGGWRTVYRCSECGSRAPSDADDGPA